MDAKNLKMIADDFGAFLKDCIEDGLGEHCETGEQFLKSALEVFIQMNDEPGEDK